jgi:hypothetical protein
MVADRDAIAWEVGPRSDRTTGRRDRAAAPLRAGGICWRWLPDQGVLVERVVTVVAAHGSVAGEPVALNDATAYPSGRRSGRRIAHSAEAA